MRKQPATMSAVPRSIRALVAALIVGVLVIAPIAVAAPRLAGVDLAAAPIAPAEQPGAEQPGAEQPGAEQPGAEQPGAEQPGAENLPPELRECRTPSVQFVVSSRIGPDKMVITVRVNDIATPGQIEVRSPDARAYVNQRLDAEGASTREATYKVEFKENGRHPVDVTVRDACGRTYLFDYEVATPFLGFTDAVACPGRLDANDLCVVPRATPVELRIPGANGTWRWDDGEDSGPNRSRIFTEDLALVFAQARQISAAGMRVTPVVPFALATTARPRITSFSVPDVISADEPFTVSFEVPDGAEEAEPSIWVDDRQIALGLTAELRLEPGVHTISFVLAWPENGGVVTRSAAVVVPERPAALGLVERLWSDPLGQVVVAAVGGILAMLLVLALVLGIRMGYRRSRGLLDGPISPFQAYRLLEKGGVTILRVERIRRRAYRFDLRCADGRTETVEVEAASLRWAWEAVISRYVGRGC